MKRTWLLYSLIQKVISISWICICCLCNIFDMPFFFFLPVPRLTSLVSEDIFSSVWSYLITCPENSFANTVDLQFYVNGIFFLLTNERQRDTFGCHNKDLGVPKKEGTQKKKEMQGNQKEAPLTSDSIVPHAIFAISPPSIHPAPTLSLRHSQILKSIIWYYGTRILVFQEPAQSMGWLRDPVAARGKLLLLQIWDVFMCSRCWLFL